MTSNKLFKLISSGRSRAKQDKEKREKGIDYITHISSRFFIYICSLSVFWGLGITLCGYWEFYISTFLKDFSILLLEIEKASDLCFLCNMMIS